MQNEISSIRREKEHIIIEKNESKLTLMKELDQDRFKLKQMQAELEKTMQCTKNFESETQKLREKTEERNEEIKELTNAKYHLVKLNV